MNFISLKSEVSSLLFFNNPPNIRMIYASRYRESCELKYDLQKFTFHMCLRKRTTIPPPRPLILISPDPECSTIKERKKHARNPPWNKWKHSFWKAVKRMGYFLTRPDIVFTTRLFITALLGGKFREDTQLIGVYTSGIGFGERRHATNSGRQTEIKRNDFSPGTCGGRSRKLLI